MLLLNIISFLFLFLNPLIVLSESDACIHCPEYVALPAAFKIARLWNRIQSTSYKHPYPPMRWPKLKLTGLFDESMNTTFDLYSDELPAKRERLVHSFGSVGLVSYIPHITNKKYTGIYKTGSKYGVMRLSLATDPGLPFSGFSPGFALKFLLDKQFSANVIGMYEILGNGQNYNFFAVQLKTKIKVPVILSSFHLLDKTFNRGASPSHILAADAPSLYDEHGVIFDRPKHPMMLYLVPTQEMKDRKFRRFPHDFRKDLANITKGTNIYDVYGTDEECMCGQDPCKDILINKVKCKAELIGTIRAESSFIPSEYGDKSLFFQHSRWVKEARVTCVYADALDAANRDSTVFSTNTRSDCQRGTSCLDRSTNKLVSRVAGCPYDAYLSSLKKVGSKNDQSNLRAIE